MKVYFILLLILSVFKSYSQSDSIRLTRSHGSYPQNDQDSIYYELFKSNLSDLKIAKYYAFACLTEANKSQHDRMKVKAYCGLTYLYEKTNAIDSVIFYFRSAIELASLKDFRDLLFFSYNNLGTLYEQMDLYDSALHYFILARDIANELQDFRDRIVVNNNIGLIYYNIGSHQESIAHFKEAIDISAKHQLTDGLNVVLMNLAKSLNEIGEHNEASEKLRIVANNCNSGCDNIILADLSYELGCYNQSKGLLQEAKIHFLKSLEYAREEGYQQTLAHTLYHLSLIAIHDHSYETALDYLKEAENISFAIKQKRIRRDVYQQLANIYHESGKLDKSIFYQKRYQQLKDSIFNEKVALNIKEIDLSEQKKIAEAVIQKKDKQIFESNLKATTIGIICILAFTVALLAYKRVKINNAQKRILEDHIINDTIEREEINKALRRKEIEFNYLVYKTSRDIRNPLMTVKGLLNLLNCDNEELKGHINQIQKDLGVKVDQLTELYQIRDQVISIDEFDIGSLSTTIYARFKDLPDFPLVSLSANKSAAGEMKTDKKLLIDLIACSVRCLIPFNSKNEIEIFLEQEETTTVISIGDRSHHTYAKLQDNIFSLFQSQITAWKLCGQIILSEQDNYTVYKIIIPTVHPEFYKEKIPLVKNDVVKI